MIWRYLDSTGKKIIRALYIFLVNKNDHNNNVFFIRLFSGYSSESIHQVTELNLSGFILDENLFADKDLIM